MGVLMSLAAGLEDGIFHICSLFATSPVNAALAATLAQLRTSNEIIRLRKDQAMWQVTPTLRLQQASCEPGEKGDSMDHLPPY
jgi:hypothetical protein